MFDRTTSKILLLIFLASTLESLKAMEYNDPISMSDLEEMFGQDGCLEGTISMLELGGPKKKISFVVSEGSTALKDKDEGTISKLYDKSPLSLVNELAVFNQIDPPKFIVTSEEGPPHKKRFLVSLQLGQERYESEGSSIKKAQQGAAHLALNSTLLSHPPVKPKKENVKKRSSVERLYSWVGNDADISFSYSGPELDSSNKNFNHKGIYSKSNNIYKAKLRVEGEEFDGEGYSKENAKEDAASKALNVLHKADGFCILDQKFRDLFFKLLNFGSDNYSPISLVHEFALKSKMEAKFDLVGEEGPAHIKRFVFKCTVGNQYETFGEGSCKKDAKLESAEKMVQKLKSLTENDALNCNIVSKIKKRKKNKPKNVIKNVVKPINREDYDQIYDDETSFPDNMDPISKLYQILQPKLIPDFKLTEEKGSGNKEFVIEVRVGDIVSTGSGSNKKQAKRKAAEGMLEKLGYSMKGKIRHLSSEHKQAEFSQINQNEKQITAGLKVNSEKFTMDKTSSSKIKPPHQSKLEDKSFNGIKQKSPSLSKNGEDSFKDKTSEKIKAPYINSRKKLENLAQELGIRFQLSDFPKQNDAGFVSIVSLTTDPPQICYGDGITKESSQVKAALNALQFLHKSQFNSISHLLKESNFQPAEDKITLEEKNEIKLFNIVTE